MGMVERLQRREQEEKRKQQTLIEKSKREWDAGEDERQAEYERKRRLTAQAKATYDNSHYSELYSELARLTNVKGEIIRWDGDGKEEYTYGPVTGQPYSYGDRVFRVIDRVELGNRMLRTTTGTFDVEFRADGKITFHGKNPETISGDSTLEELDTALGRAYSNPVIKVLEYKKSSNQGGGRA